MRILQLKAARGCGMFNSRACPVLTNCVFNGNTASVEGGAMRNDDDSHPIVSNGILWDDNPDEIVQSKDSLTTMNYSTIMGGWPDAGNIDADPLVVDMGAYEFQPTACPWDCGGDNDGNVGINDFLELLANWGPCP